MQRHASPHQHPRHHLKHLKTRLEIHQVVQARTRAVQVSEPPGLTEAVSLFSGRAEDVVTIFDLQPAASRVLDGSVPRGCLPPATFGRGPLARLGTIQKAKD